MSDKQEDDWEPPVTMSQLGLSKPRERSELHGLPCSAPITDKQRLDWLIGNSAFLSHSLDGDMCNVWYSHDPNDECGRSSPVEGYPQKCYGTAREAIDAVINL